MGRKEAQLNVEIADLETKHNQERAKQLEMESSGNAASAYAFGTAGMTTTQYSSVGRNSFLSLRYTRQLREKRNERSAIQAQRTALYGEYGDDLKELAVEEAAQEQEEQLPQVVSQQPVYDPQAKEKRKKAREARLKPEQDWRRQQEELARAQASLGRS